MLQSLNEFNIRIGELVRRVRNLPQTGYLLPMYNLLVEAAEREEGAVRALRNSWQPFTVDAFIAVDRERGRCQWTTPRGQNSLRGTPQPSLTIGGATLSRSTTTRPLRSARLIYRERPGIRVVPSTRPLAVRPCVDSRRGPYMGRG